MFNGRQAMPRCYMVKTGRHEAPPSSPSEGSIAPGSPSRVIFVEKQTIEPYIQNGTSSSDPVSHPIAVISTASENATRQQRSPEETQAAHDLLSLSQGLHGCTYVTVMQSNPVLIPGHVLQPAGVYILGEPSQNTITPISDPNQVPIQHPVPPLYSSITSPISTAGSSSLISDSTATSNVHMAKVAQSTYSNGAPNVVLGIRTPLASNSSNETFEPVATMVQISNTNNYGHIFTTAQSTSNVPTPNVTLTDSHSVASYSSVAPFVTVATLPPVSNTTAGMSQSSYCIANPIMSVTGSQLETPYSSSTPFVTVATMEPFPATTSYDYTAGIPQTAYYVVPQSLSEPPPLISYSSTRPTVSVAKMPPLSTFSTTTSDGLKNATFPLTSYSPVINYVRATCATSPPIPFSNSAIVLSTESLPMYNNASQEGSASEKVPLNYCTAAIRVPERTNSVIDNSIATPQVMAAAPIMSLPPPRSESVESAVTSTVKDPQPCLNQPKYSCGVCGKRYATSSNLSRHKQTHRSLNSLAARRCSECGKTYVSMPALAMHEMTHRMIHCCYLCGKHFSRPWLLRGHIRSHTGERPYVCASCGKAFADRSNFRAHLQTHTVRKRFHCPRCGRNFALKSYLNKHLDSALCVRQENE